MSQKYSFLVDLSGVELSDSSSTWIQAFPMGTWNHPTYGEIQMNLGRAEQMAANIKANVRGQELDIDYDHKALTNIAAGWVKDAEARTDGLWLSVEWTTKALDAIKQKEYRYFSPEYTDEWTSPIDNKVHKDVVFGGALTNRPFLKGILPINLSEWNAELQDPIIGGSLDPKEIRQLLKLGEDVTDEQVVTKLNELMEAAKLKPGQKAEPYKPGDKKAQSENEDPTIQVLAESNPIVRTMLDEITALKAANRLSEVNLGITQLEAQDGNFALAPAILAEVRTLALEAPKAVGDKLFTILSEVRKSGIIDLREHGGGKPGSASVGDSATKQFTDAIAKIATERKLSYADASNAAASENPELFDGYRNESYTRERGA